MTFVTTNKNIQRVMIIMLYLVSSLFLSMSRVRLISTQGSTLFLPTLIAVVRLWWSKCVYGLARNITMAPVKAFTLV